MEVFRLSLIAELRLLTGFPAMAFRSTLLFTASVILSGNFTPFHTIGLFHFLHYMNLLKIYQGFFTGNTCFLCNSGQTVPFPSLFAQNEGDEIQVFAAAGLDHFTISGGVFVILSDPVLPEFLIAFGFLNGKKLRVF